MQRCRNESVKGKVEVMPPCGCMVVVGLNTASGSKKICRYSAGSRILLREFLVGAGKNIVKIIQLLLSEKHVSLFL